MLGDLCGISRSSDRVCGTGRAADLPVAGGSAGRCGLGLSVMINRVIRRLQRGCAAALVAAACCNALLPVPADSFALSQLPPPAPEAASQRFSLHLKGGERSPPPPSRLATSMQAHGSGVLASSSGPRLFAVEGLIGAGKSTLLAKLRGADGVAIIPEPLDKWQETGIFEAFYKDMGRWSFTFQMAAFVSRVQAAEEALQSAAADPDRSLTSLIGERSWCADAHVFEPLLHRDGHISALEHATYQDWWRWVESKAPAMAGVIYLRARPATCLARIQKRKREAEAGIPLEYLQGLFEQHEDWLVHRRTGYGAHNLPVLVLDADADFEGNSALSESMMHKIREFTADPHHYAARHGPGGAELQVPGGCSPQDMRPQNVPASTERNGA